MNYQKNNLKIFIMIVSLLTIGSGLTSAQNAIAINTTINSTSCNSTSATFTVSKQSSGYTYTWTCITAGKAEESLGTGASVSKIFSNGGLYLIQLHSQNDILGTQQDTTTTLIVEPYAYLTTTAIDESTGKISFTLHYTAGNTYSIDFGDGTSSTVSSSSTTHTYTKQGVYRAIITATGSTCSNKDTVAVKVTSSYFTDTTYVVGSDSINMFPNVFSPDGEKYKLFQIPTNGKNEYTLEIYNQGGILVYKSVSPLIQWDGRLLNNEKAKQGLYFYIIRLNGEALPKDSKKGKKVHPLMLYR
jgi:hypothetical protein